MERAKDMENSLPLMKDREKGEMDRLLDTNVTIVDFGFMSDVDGDYVAFVVKEDPQNFYFGGKVLTDHMHAFEAEGYTELIKKDGLPVLFGKKKSKNKNEKGGALTYTTVKFYPEA